MIFPRLFQAAGTLIQIFLNKKVLDPQVSLAFPKKVQARQKSCEISPYLSDFRHYLPLSPSPLLMHSKAGIKPKYPQEPNIWRQFLYLQKV